MNSDNNKYKDIVRFNELLKFSYGDFTKTLMILVIVYIQSIGNIR